MQYRRWIAVLLVAFAAWLATGCGDRVSERPAGDARQLISEGFGARTLSDQAAPDDVTVLSALRARHDVTTAYGGGFVKAIDGLAWDLQGKRDWFYFVNGTSPGRGADQVRLRPGDTVWWDYRPWGGAPDVDAVVGLWPEPFVHGYPERPETVSADPPLDAVLRDAGVVVATTPSPWRARVDTDAALRRRDPAWRRAMTDPADAGLTIRIDGSRISALRADGRTFAVVPNGRAVAAAVLTGESPEAGGFLLAVAGVDRPSADAAARRIARDPDVLRGRFAVVFDAAGTPIAAGGVDRL